MTPDELARLHAACFETPRPWSMAEFSSLLDMRGVYLCEAGGHGFALGRLMFDECELLTLAVAPSARRQGIGRQLLADFEAHGVNAGARAAFLEVSSGNLPARRLYEGQGYRHAGTRKGYYRAALGRRIDALVLRRDLD